MLQVSPGRQLAVSNHLVVDGCEDLRDDRIGLYFAAVADIVGGECDGAGRCCARIAGDASPDVVIMQIADLAELLAELLVFGIGLIADLRLRVQQSV